jgi:hypothetical protein
VPLDCSLLPWSPHWAPSLVIVVTGFRFGGIRGCRAGSWGVGASEGKWLIAWFRLGIDLSSSTLI